jgi:hypothetical protein
MAVWNEPSPYTEYNDLIKKSMTFQYQFEDLTLDDIRSASSNYLRSCLKEDISPETSDMIDKELYVREMRRPIV